MRRLQRLNGSSSSICALCCGIVIDYNIINRTGEHIREAAWRQAARIPTARVDSAEEQDQPSICAVGVPTARDDMAGLARQNDLLVGVVCLSRRACLCLSLHVVCILAPVCVCVNACVCVADLARR